MDIIIKESGVAKPLVYMDTATGTECTLDILQMMGAFTNGTITYTASKLTDAANADSKTFIWTLGTPEIN